MPDTPTARAAPAASGSHAASGYLLALVATAVTVPIALAAQRWLHLGDVALVFIVAVLATAARTRTGPAIAAAVLCFLAYNFFFIEPRYTLAIASARDVATVALFLVVALLAGRLASRLAMQVRSLGLAHRDASARHELALALADAASCADIERVARDVFSRILDAHAWLRLGPAHAAAAQEHGWWHLPLPGPQAPPGLLIVKFSDADATGESSLRSLVRAMAADIAQALRRVQLAQELETERVSRESERLRDALLASVSHDLRTPLASIIGAADSLHCYGAALGEADRGMLLDTIRDEGERLDRYVQNLLDMTRLGHGALQPVREWAGLDEIVGAVLARMRRHGGQAAFETSIDPALPPLWVQSALIEQALFNVVENAARFSPAGEPVRIAARCVADRVRIDVTDAGPGIPPDERANVFDMFYSVERGDRASGGTGLGLAISRGFVAAHGGEVAIASGPRGRGTVVTLWLPAAQWPAETAS